MGPTSIGPRIRSVLAGDRDALAWIYDTFAPGLMRRLGQRFQNSLGLEAEDLLHDTFVYVLRPEARVLERFLDRPGVPTEASLSQFLWSAACGIASNRRRSLVRHPTTLLRDHQATTEARDEEPVLARDALERLARCLLRRGDRSYLYFQLRFRSGLTPAEVAATTGWSKRATYKLKQLLDAALVKCLEELGLRAT